jgi:hypothetical protein
MRPLYALLLLLAACGPLPVITDAPAMASYSTEEQQRIKSAYHALPADSPLRPVIRDCKALRNQVRATP